MSAEDDVIIHGGGEAHLLLTPEGIDDFYIARQVVLANEVSVATVARGELGPAQQSAAFLVTFQGRLNEQKKMIATTLVFEPDMALALWKALRQKYIEIPIDQRT